LSAHLPIWLDPWWHLDYQSSSTLAPDAVKALLQKSMSRLRGWPDGPKALILVRRGGFMNQFVRARATLAPSGSGTAVMVRIARPSYMSVLMAGTGVLIIAGPVVQTILFAMTKGLEAGLPASAVFVPLGPVIWAMVMGANFTSARSEARDLVGLIGAALAPDRERLTEKG
jgi:hypothetical protein